MPSSPRIDSHQHFWSVARTDYGWLTPAAGALSRLPARRSRAAPERGRHLTHGARPSRTDFGGDALSARSRAADFLRRARWSAGSICSPPMRPTSSPGSRRNRVSAAFVPCCRTFPTSNGFATHNCGRRLRALIDHELCFDALVRPAHLPALLEMMQRHPTLPVVIDHGAKPNIAAGQHDNWARQMRVIARDSPACCKVSGLVTEAAPGVDPRHPPPIPRVLLRMLRPGPTHVGQRLAGDESRLRLHGVVADDPAVPRAIGSRRAGNDPRRNSTGFYRI